MENQIHLALLKQYVDGLYKHIDTVSFTFELYMENNLQNILKALNYS